MGGTWSMLAEPFEMHGSSITLMLIKSITGILLMQRQAVCVTGGLGQDRGSRYRLDGCVAANDGFGYAGQPSGQAIAVDQRLVGLHRQPLAGSAHGQHGRLKDIERVDFVDAGACYAPGQGPLAYQVAKLLAMPCSQFLGIIQASYAAPRIQYDGGRKYWARKRAAARFVYACNTHHIAGIQGTEKIRLAARLPSHGQPAQE